MARVEFFFDCSSPWTYLAFHRIEGALRIGLGRATTEAEVDEAAQRLVTQVRSLSGRSRA